MNMYELPEKLNFMKKVNEISVGDTLIFFERMDVLGNRIHYVAYEYNELGLSRRDTNTAIKYIERFITEVLKWKEWDIIDDEGFYVVFKKKRGHIGRILHLC